jgi:hypothetical protein
VDPSRRVEEEMVATSSLLSASGPHFVTSAGKAKEDLDRIGSSGQNLKSSSWQAGRPEHNFPGALFMGKLPRPFGAMPAADAIKQTPKRNVVADEGGDGGSFASELQQAMVAFRKGDFSVRLAMGWSGVQGRIADLFNEIVEMSERRSQQAAEVARIVGKEGRLRQRMATGGFTGGWAEEVEALNTLMVTWRDRRRRSRARSGQSLKGTWA